LIDGREHVPRPEQDAAARRALTADLACRQPSIDGSHIDATQLSDFAFCQKLVVVEVLRRHHPFPSRGIPFAEG
jgi:hypothetical protein